MEQVTTVRAANQKHENQQGGTSVKLQSQKTIEIKGRVIGGEKYLYCISVRPDCMATLKTATAESAAYNPDIMEWRIDSYDKVFHAADENDPQVIEDVLEALRTMTDIAEGIPFLICMRAFEEGGVKKYSNAFRYRIYEACMKTGLVDLVDIETLGDQDWNRKIIDAAHANGVTVVCSNHTYTGIIDEEHMIMLCKRNAEAGGDISKTLVMAKDDRDVAIVANSMRRVKEERIIDVPFCFYAMGEAGITTRVVGGEYGADYAYFSLRETIEGSLGESTADYLGLSDLFARKD